MSDAVDQQVATAIRERIPDAEVQAVVEGNRASIVVISREFDGLSRVKQQQAVYACINHLIADGTLHAVTIQARVPGASG